MTVSSHFRAASPAGSLRALAGVVLLAALAVAPLNFGSTRPLAFASLIGLVGVGAAAWLLAGGIRWSEPPPALACAGLALVALSILAWAFFLSPPESPLFTKHHYARLVARWPFSLVPRDRAWLLGWAAVAAVGLVALCDFARDPAWRRALAVVLLSTGALVAFLGLAQNATHARGIYWDGSHRLPGAFFGTFYHHTSAGAYLNTVWPVGLGLAIDGLRIRAASPRGKLFVIAAFFLTFVMLAAHAGHVSRFPQVIALVALVVFAAWTRWWRVLGQMRGGRVLLGVLTAAVALAVFGFGASRTTTIAARWNLLHLQDLRGGRTAVPPPPPAEWPRLMRDDLFVPSDHRNFALGDRGAAYVAASAAIAKRPWFGWGPGGWTAAAAAHSVDPFVRTFFLFVQFTHCDALQTCVEWGLVGGLGWALLVPGSVFFALWRLRSRASRDYLGAGAVVGLIAVLVQSLIDFPLQIPAIQFNAVALAALAWTVPAAAAALPSPSLS